MVPIPVAYGRQLQLLSQTDMHRACMHRVHIVCVHVIAFFMVSENNSHTSPMGHTADFLTYNTHEYIAVCSSMNFQNWCMLISQVQSKVKQTLEQEPLYI